MSFILLFLQLVITIICMSTDNAYANYIVTTYQLWSISLSYNYSHGVSIAWKEYHHLNESTKRLNSIKWPF